VIQPWAVTVDRLVSKPKVFTLDELLKPAPLEERIYRMRCIKDWSMVIPWIGVSRLGASVREIKNRIFPATER
jgi:sulfoxide reductase catalytic subunit YedY